MSLSRPVRGMSLMDVVVGSALTLIIFLALFGLLRASLLVSSLAKTKAVATATANSQMEYVRSLDYDSVGTVGGIPSGVIAETATTTENGLVFVTRTFVQYVDDAKDGLGAADETGIITDYKLVKVTVSYTVDETPREVELISNFAPPGIETTAGGGTLQIVVVDAAGSPVGGATVHIENPSLSPAVDVTTFTNASGIVYLPGAATSTDYRVEVTKSGYSSAQTYARDATNQNPSPGYLTVAESQTTTGTFAIDTLASLTLRTFSPVATSTWSDTFADNSKLAAENNASASGGALALLNTAGSYAAAGDARSDAIAPSILHSWIEASSTVSIPADTTLRVHVVDGGGALVPDTDLPGNSSGFTSFPIDLSGLSTTTYPSLALEVEMGSANTLVTPSVSFWAIGYREGPLPLPNVAYALTGGKTVGTTGAGDSIYKTEVSGTTGGSAVAARSLEWDIYTAEVTGYDVVDACAAPPFVLSPGQSYDHSFILDTDTADALLVTVHDSAGAPVPGASVTVERGASAETVVSSSCGTAYFGGLTAASDYSITIAKTGYTTSAFANVPVSGDTFYEAVFP